MLAILNNPYAVNENLLNASGVLVRVRFVCGSGHGRGIVSSLGVGQFRRDLIVEALFNLKLFDINSANQHLGRVGNCSRRTDAMWTVPVVF